MLNKKKRYKPFYKHFLIIRKNVQNRIKVFNFKKKKWKTFQYHALKKLRFFKRYKIQDQFKVKVSKFANKGNSFKKYFKKSLINRKLFNIFYGGLKQKYLKKKINYIKKTKRFQNKFQNYRHQVFIKIFESRLDTVLYRSKICLSVKSCRQLIRHGHVLVNNIIVKSSSYLLQPNDLIEIKIKNNKIKKLIEDNILKSNCWPIPPKHLVINYRTCQILFISDKSSNYLPLIEHYLNIDSVINNINKF